MTYKLKNLTLAITLALGVGTITGCANTSSSMSADSAKAEAESSAASNGKADTKVSILGTTTPFASEAIYFVMTDRFVDGDPGNNYEDQGGNFPTWQLPMEGPNGEKAYVGYMGGDLKGVLNNGDYIRDMGFTAVWMTPVLENPNQSFSGDEQITFGVLFHT